MILICARRGGDLEAEKEGFFLRVCRAADAICSDSAGVNYKARGITALRHPGSIILPCLAHVAAPSFSDLLKTGPAADVEGG